VNWRSILLTADLDLRPLELFLYGFNRKINLRYNMKTNGRQVLMQFYTAVYLIVSSLNETQMDIFDIDS